MQKAYRANSVEVEGGQARFLSPVSPLRCVYAVGERTSPYPGTYALTSHIELAAALRVAVSSSPTDLTVITEVVPEGNFCEIHWNQILPMNLDKRELLRWWEHETVDSLALGADTSDFKPLYRGDYLFVSERVLTLQVLALYDRRARVVQALSHWAGQFAKAADRHSLNCSVQPVSNFVL